MTWTATLVIIAATVAGCSGDSTGSGSPSGSTSPGSEGRDTAAPPEAAALSDASDGGTTSGFDAGPACTRNATYDTNCADLKEPPAAYICYDPGGGQIPAACVINMGALVVCCPQ